jgi:putative transposase
MHCGCRDECLNEEVFRSLAEARNRIERWRVDYTRPHLAHVGIAPAVVLRRNAGDRLCNPDQLRRSPAPTALSALIDPGLSQ